MTNIQEFFLPIKGYEGIYEVSNIGTVKSLDRVVDHPRWGSQTVYGRIMKPSNFVGYHGVGLSINGKCKIYKVHRLVATAFIPLVENKNIVNHKNGIKTDNRVENLEWCTQDENRIHAIANGFDTKGVRNGRNKLTNEQAIEVFKSKGKIKETTEKYGICKAVVHNIRVGKLWSHITSKIKT